MSTDAAHLAKLYELIDGVETALLVTRRADGALVSRPMATQKGRRGSVRDLQRRQQDGRDRPTTRST